MKYRYAIIDLTSPVTFVKTFDKEQDARNEIYILRKRRYIEEHPDSPEWEYDTIKIDNGYNVIKYTLVA